jgi:NAD(P)-dependent dehydrogenase (short-subunit alcohol dehydrogenase family)
MGINVWGVLASMKHEIPAMLAAGGGSIVNNASIAGILGFNAMSVYTASKHAVVGLTRTTALEMAQAGVRVNAVAPGPIDTEMYDRFASDEVKEMIANSVPQGKAGQAADIAAGVLWLSHPITAYTTGQVLAIDGGYSVQ